MFDYTREKIHQQLWDLRHHLAVFPKRDSQKILVIQVEGLGNAILTTPLIQAISTLTPKPKIDILIAKQRGSDIVFQDWPLINRVWDWQELEAWPERIFYDAVLECHPRRYLAQQVKYRKRYRIKVPQIKGLDYFWWFEKHEADYLVDLARSLGYRGDRPPIRHPLPGCNGDNIEVAPQTVAIGIGYFKGLRADGRDWRDRHWGNDKYLALCHILEAQGFHPVLVGDDKDYQADGWELEQAGIESICGKLTLPQVVDYLGRCQAFIGNDTGLMHVAAAQGISTIGIFVNTNSIKSYPLGPKCLALGGDEGPGHYDISVRQVWESFQKWRVN